MVGICRLFDMNLIFDPCRWIVQRIEAVSGRGQVHFDRRINSAELPISGILAYLGPSGLQGAISHFP